MDTLDYTVPAVNEGSKGVMLGVGEPRRSLPRHFDGALPAGVRRAEVFCGGCLVIEAEGRATDPEAGARLARCDAFADWPLVVLVDDAAQATRSEFNFLWVTFTRFEPAADIHARAVELRRMHPSFEGCILVDARLGEGFPDELFCDPETARRVEDRWRDYFPAGGVEMGDSDRAHLDGP